MTLSQKKSPLELNGFKHLTDIALVCPCYITVELPLASTFTPHR